MTTRTAYRTCPLCEATCGLEITVEGDGVRVIRGDRDNPFSRGFICPKGSTLGRLRDDPDRLRWPLVKRDGVHVEVTWEEAFVEVTARLTPILAADRQAVAFYIGNPNAHSFQNTLAIRPLIKAAGTRNVYSASTVDQMPRQVACAFLFGGGLTTPVPDLDRTDHLIVLGANPYESNGSLATAPDWPGRLEAIRARGGRVVVVDPRRTRTAENADEHVAIRPGSDAALLLAMASTLFEEGLVDLAHLDDHVTGLDQVAAAIAGLTPELVAGFCGVEAETIRRMARELAAAPSACVYGRIGTHTVAFGTLSAWAADLLNVLTGNLDRPGGAMFASPIHETRTRRRRAFAPGRWRSRVRGLPEVFGELPVATLADEILTDGDGRVQALVTIAGNPVLTTPDAGRLDRALDELDFMVSVDPYLNETTRHADVILPPPPALEKSHFDLAFTVLSVRNYAMYSPPVFPLAEGSMSEFDILVKLTGIAMGFGPEADARLLFEMSIAQQVQAEVADPTSPIHGRDPSEILAALSEWDGPERGLDLMLRLGRGGDGFGADPDGWTLRRVADHPHGVDLGPLEPRIPGILATPSGTVELAPELILADVPRLEAALDSAADGMLLVGRRELRSNNSWLHNVEVLVKGRERCTLEIHPDDAARLGLADGDLAAVASRVGRVELPVRVTESIRRGVVSIPYGWGHGAEGSRLTVAAKRPGVNTNLLTDAEPIDPLSGNAVLNGIPVEVAPVG
jgi:anaerobic selenocysteine-containing dehydrogenase